MKSGYLKIIKAIKIIAITALICTTALFFMLVIESSLSSTVSGNLSNFVTGKVDSSLNVTDKIEENKYVQSIQITHFSPSYGFYAIGDEVKVNTTLYPEQSHEEEVVYSVDNSEIATVSEDGVITLLKKGSVFVTATLKSNPSISHTKGIWCVGEDVLDDSCPEKLKVELNRASKSNVIKTGEKVYLTLNDGKTYIECAKVTSSDTSIAVTTANSVYGVAPGTVDVTVVIERGGVQKSVTLPIVVKEGEYLPITNLSGASEIILTDGARNVDYHQYIDMEEGKKASDYDCSLSSEDGSTVSVKGNRLSAYQIGTVKVTFTSAYNPSLSFCCNVVVKPKPIEGFSIIGDDRTIPHKEVLYIGEHSPEKYSDFVTWSVVKGDATIDSNGKLIANNFGKVTIRCQSTLDSSVYAEKVVKVGFFEDAYGFVRKFMGHMGLHALLGFGVTFTLLFLSKRKIFTALSPVIGFLTALLTEDIQYFTPGRTCLWTDVVIDFTGSLIGVGVAVLLALAITLVWFLVSKKGVKKMVKALSKMNITNIFKSSDKILDVVEVDVFGSVTAIDDL